MPFNVDVFRHSFLFGPSNPALFDVLVLPPRALLGTAAISAEMVFRCDTAELPGKSIQTLDAREYGPTRKISYGANFAEVGLEFIESEDSLVHQFFIAWSDLISDDKQIPIGQATHDVGYYNDYVGSVKIVQYSVDGSVIKAVNLVDAFPSGVAAVPLAWEANGQLMKIRISMAYRLFQQGNAPPLRGAATQLVEGIFNRLR